jgi:hypothetical protein
MPSNSPPPGAYVLGMHRSGTSVLAGVLDHLGLDVGARELMFDADRFNSDGYWERRDVVESHDRALRRLGGWASAPPPIVVHQDIRIDRWVDEVTELLTAYEGPWMVKDPRQCLMLPTWLRARGGQDLHVISVRHPVEVQRSLTRRNGYAPELGLALWERYMFDALRGSRGRRALIVDYDELTTNPSESVEVIADALTPTLLGGVAPSSEAIRSAVELIRPSREREPRGSISTESERLYDALMDRRGPHDSLDVGSIELGGSSRRVIDHRRRRLNVAGFAARGSAVLRGRLDRRLVPG